MGDLTNCMEYHQGLRLNGMKIIVTGNMGYVGPVLISHLRSVFTNAEIIGIDQGFFGHCLTSAGALPERRLDVQYFMDVRKVPDTLLKDANAIVHLAAISNDPMGKAYEDMTNEINYEIGRAHV